MQKEKEPRYEQTIQIVNGTPFIRTRFYREDVNGSEFITFENTQPYQGSIEDLKRETEEAKAKAQEVLEARIADADSKLAEIDKALPVDKVEVENEAAGSSRDS